jgi:hypothetical protein
MKGFSEGSYLKVRLYEHKSVTVSIDGSSTCFQLLPGANPEPGNAEPADDLNDVISRLADNLKEEEPRITASSLVVDPTTDVAFVVNTNSTVGVAGPAFDTFGFGVWSFIIENAAAVSAPATAILQLSPDNILWTNDSLLYSIPQTNDIVTLVANRFMRYARVYYAAVNAASAITLIIFFQGQS